MAALVVFGAILASSGCSLVFEQHDAISTDTTVPPGAFGPGAEAVPGGAGFGDSDASSTTTTESETTTTTGLFSGYSIDDLPPVATHTDDPLCEQTDAVVLTGTTIANFGSTVDSRPSTLTPSQRADAYQELLAFRDGVTKLLNDLEAQGLLPQATEIQASIASFSRRVDEATPEDDVRQLFLNFMQSDGASLQQILTDVTAPRCPTGLLSKVDPD